MAREASTERNPASSPQISSRATADGKKGRSLIRPIRDAGRYSRVFTRVLTGPRGARTNYTRGANVVDLRRVEDEDEAAVKTAVEAALVGRHTS